MPDKKTPQGIVQLRLHTHRLADLRKFYHNVFDLPIKEEGKTSLTIQAGSTLLTFEQTEDKDSRPFYHFAFNIPENMLPKAKVWLTKRTPLITRGTEDEYHFREWNAHAVYFWDPAENIVEFIARHNLANAKEGEFKSEDVLSASEIGLVVDDVPETTKILKEQLALQTYKNPAKNFEAVGDEHQLFIVVQKERLWFPNQEYKKKGDVFPTSVNWRGEKAATLELKGYPYKIDVQRG